MSPGPSSALPGALASLPTRRSCADQDDTLQSAADRIAIARHQSDPKRLLRRATADGLIYHSPEREGRFIPLTPSGTTLSPIRAGAPNSRGAAGGYRRRRTSPAAPSFA